MIGRKLIGSRGLWICVAVFILDLIVAFVPLVAATLLILAIKPGWGVSVTAFFIHHYNAIHGTHFEILDISNADEKLKADRIV